MRFTTILLACGLTGLGAAACGNDSELAPDGGAARVTWYQDVAPIVANHCMSCHQAGGIAPFPLTDYEAVVENSTRMLHEIDRGAMPPFDAREEPDCSPRFSWVDDPRLTIQDKTTLRAWIEAGHPLGTVAEIPAPPSTALSGITKTLVPSEPWTTSGDRDQFICFVLDPGNTQLEWLTGLQVRPDNDLVVHHAVITEVPPGAAHDALVAQRGIGKPFECGTATPGNFVVNVWTPGNQPMQTSSDIAVPILAGAKLVMQIHYHPANLVNAPDATAVDLRFSSVWPKRMYFVGAFGNAFQSPELLPGTSDAGTPRFLIPAQVADHRERMRITIPDLGDTTDVRLFSANPHMHLIGTHISAKIERTAARGTDPKDECLANGAWNFDWQRTYQYAAPLDQLPSIAAGDVIDIECRWDNTIENPFVQRMMHDANLSAPIDVTLGEQTTNEMCLQIFGLSIPAPAEPAQRPATIELPTAFGEITVASLLRR